MASIYFKTETRELFQNEIARREATPGRRVTPSRIRVYCSALHELSPTHLTDRIDLFSSSFRRGGGLKGALPSGWKV